MSNLRQRATEYLQKRFPSAPVLLCYGTIALDKDTHYLAATTKLLPDPEKGDWAVIDTIYYEHKEVQSVVVPMRMVSYKDGNLLLDVTVKKLEILKSVETSDFARPD